MAESRANSPARLPGRATEEGTLRFAARGGERLRAGYRRAASWAVSTVGMGTYLGEAEEDRPLVQAAARQALSLGINFFDSAINYRHQASERDLGVALRAAIDADEVAREEVVLCTKGGFLPLDFEEGIDNPRKYLADHFLTNGLCPPDEIVGGCQSIAPGLIDRLFEMSRENLGVETVDIYLLHNPEMQLEEIERRAFLERLRRAFEVLARKVDEGALSLYGVATWDGLRKPADEGGLSLDELRRVAVEVEGPNHHFGAIQLPLNLAMTEALVHQHESRTVLDAAEEMGLLVMTSASIMQGQLARGLPEQFGALFPGLETDAQRALQHTRCAPGVTTALVGMKQPEHVAENAALLEKPRLSPDFIRKLYANAS